jgi:outer membrane receptor for Fe3+-dicitrate
MLKVIIFYLIIVLILVPRLTQIDITQFDIVNGTNVLNTNNTDVFNYDESIYAAYLSYDEKWKKWSLSTGLRFEQTNIEGLSIVSNQKNDQDYFEWFPTINLSYMISEKVNVYTNYKRSVVRPDYQSLNPFRFFLNDNIIYTGNPNLKPSFLNHVVIGTSISNSYIIEAYYQKNESSFLELPIQNNIENQLIYTPTNLSNTIEYGFDFSAFFNISDNWFVYFVTSFYNSEDKAMFNNESIKTNTWSNYSVLSNDLSLLKDESLTANFTLIYNGKNQLGFQINDTRIHTDLSIKKSIFKKKGNLSLHFADLLNKQDEEITSKYLDQYNSRHVNLDNRYIKLGFSYKFGNTILKTNERIKDRQERDRLKERQ